MTAPTDQSAALAILRERFPESEGWARHAAERLSDGRYSAYAENRIVGAHYLLGRALADSAVDAARTLIASWDAATHAAQVRALVEALAPLAWCIRFCHKHDLNGFSDHNTNEQVDALDTALAALPASLRGKGAPSFDDLRGIDITSGEDPVRYVRKMRDGEEAPDA